MEIKLDSQKIDPYIISRRRMVDEQLISRDITDARVLAAMMKVPRHLFVDEALQNQAYGDFPLNIGLGQTISQPYSVALMTQALNLMGHEKVLEIGTGCGYQTSILAETAFYVYTIERLKDLGLRARRTLKDLGYRKISIRIGDGTRGWPEAAPFDCILVAAGSPELPLPLLYYLSEGGRLVCPVGEDDQQRLTRITRRQNQYIQEDLGPCRFVKLVGRFGWQNQRKVGEKFQKRSIV